MPRPSPYKAKVTAVSDLPNGKWIATKKIDYLDPSGNPRVWEMAVRTTRRLSTLQGEPNVDAVSIVSVLRDPRNTNHVPQLVVVKQFRPPTSLVVLEFPAGLVDPNESIASTAERELVEETGYHGMYNRTLRELFSDPGLTNASMVLAYVDVDLLLPRNHNPQPQLQDGEFIETVLLPIPSLKQELEKLMDTEQCSIDARLYHFAEGLEFARSL